MKLHSFTTVSDAELTKLLSYKKMRNFFLILEAISRLPGVPENWLITSIDFSAHTKQARSLTNGVNHVNSQAVDVVPLTDSLLIRLPIPLNRNLLLMRLFHSQLKTFPINELPIIAFESDHIHVDVNHKGGVAYFNKVRPSLDRVIAAFTSTNSGYRSALDNAELIYI